MDPPIGPPGTDTPIGPPGEMAHWEQKWIGGEGIANFRADIGLAGGKRGFEGITGKF